jgi:hypothetical protein
MRSLTRTVTGVLDRILHIIRMTLVVEENHDWSLMRMKSLVLETQWGSYARI